MRIGFHLSSHIWTKWLIFQINFDVNMKQILQDLLALPTRLLCYFFDDLIKCIATMSSENSVTKRSVTALLNPPAGLLILGSYLLPMLLLSLIENPSNTSHALIWITSIYLSNNYCIIILMFMIYASHTLPYQVSNDWFTLTQYSNQLYPRLPRVQQNTACVPAMHCDRSS